MMMSLRCALLIAVLLSGIDGRAKFGKLSLRPNRQVNQRDYRAFSNPINNVQPQQYVHQEQYVQPEEYVQPAQHIEPIPSVQLVQPVQPVEVPQPVNAQPQNIVPAEAEARHFHNSIGNRQVFAQPRPVASPQNFLQKFAPQAPLKSTLIGARQIGGNYQAGVGNYNQVGVPQQYPRPAVVDTGAYSRPQLDSLLSKLISNATLIRKNIVEGFSCADKPYGYYSDPLNDCQIFHICYPLRDVHKNDPALDTVPDVTYWYSFICNAGLRFSQAALTCTWYSEFEGCEYVESLYKISNQDFGKVPEQDTTVAGYYQPAPAPAPVGVGGQSLPGPGQVYPGPQVLRG